ncbi:MAG: hypothetical protein AAF573_02855 [Bacteroidota bacterium]
MNKIYFFSSILLLVSLLSCSQGDTSYLGAFSEDSERFPFTFFDKVESYSLNRVKKDTATYRILSERLDLLTDQILAEREKGHREKSLSLIQQTVPLRDSIAQLGIDQFEPSLILDKANFTFAKTAKQKESVGREKYQELRKIIADSNPSELEYSECTPIYRDALLFKNEDKIVGWIDLCFSCNQISSFPKSDIYLTPHQWEMLRQFFLTLNENG